MFGKCQAQEYKDRTVLLLNHGEIAIEINLQIFENGLMDLITMIMNRKVDNMKLKSIISTNFAQHYVILHNCHRQFGAIKGAI